MPIVRDQDTNPQRDTALDLSELRERAALLEYSAEIADLYLAAGLDVPEHVAAEVTELSAIRYTLARRTGALTDAALDEQRQAVHVEFQQQATSATDVIGGEAA